MENLETSINNYWGIEKHVQDTHPDLKFNPIPGYQGENRSVKSENIFGLTYEHARNKADNLLKQINTEKANQLQKSSRYVK